MVSADTVIEDYMHSETSSVFLTSCIFRPLIKNYFHLKTPPPPPSFFKISTAFYEGVVGGWRMPMFRNSTVILLHFWSKKKSGGGGGGGGGIGGRNQLTGIYLYCKYLLNLSFPPLQDCSISK